MSKAPGKLKNVKNLWNRIKEKGGAILNKVSNVMKKLKPVVDTVTDFVPGIGDKIDKVYDIVQQGADVGGKLLTNQESRDKAKQLLKTGIDDIREHPLTESRDRSRSRSRARSKSKMRQGPYGGINEPQRFGESNVNRSVNIQHGDFVIHGRAPPSDIDKKTTKSTNHPSFLNNKLN